MILDTAFPLAPIWDSAAGFVGLMVIATAAFGLASRSMTVASMAGYITFVYLSIEGDIPVLKDLAYITLVVVHLGLAFKFIRAEVLGDI